MEKKDKIEEIIEALMIKAFFEKFTRGKKIYIHGMYNFLKNKVGLVWLKEKPFYSKARKIYKKFYMRYRNAKKQKTLQKIQNKYKKLKIVESYTYLHYKDKFHFKNEDFEIFEEFLEILFSDIKKK